MGRTILWGFASWFLAALMSLVVMGVVAAATSKSGVAKAESALLYVWVSQLAIFIAATVLYARVLAPGTPAVIIHGAIGFGTLLLIAFIGAVAFNR